MISHLAIPRLGNDGITLVWSGWEVVSRKSPIIHPFIHPSIMTKWENSIHVQRIIAMVNWIGGPTLGKPFGEHIGNMVGICWENKYEKFHHHISPLPLPKETKKKYEALFVVKMVILHTKIFKKVWLSSLGRFNQIWLFFYYFFSLLIIGKSREPLLVKISPNKNKAW